MMVTLCAIRTLFSYSIGSIKQVWSKQCDWCLQVLDERVAATIANKDSYEPVNITSPCTIGTVFHEYKTWSTGSGLDRKWVKMRTMPMMTVFQRLNVVCVSGRHPHHKNTYMRLMRLASTSGTTPVGGNRRVYVSYPPSPCSHCMVPLPSIDTITHHFMLLYQHQCISKVINEADNDALFHFDIR